MGGESECQKTTDYNDHLLQLIVGQNTATQAWTKFLITAQGGLAVGFGFVAKEDVASIPSWMSFLLSWLVPLIGITSTVAISSVIKRDYQWQAWYIRKYNSRPGNNKQVFPEQKAADGQP